MSKPLKIPSCFQAHVNLSFRSPAPWASSWMVWWMIRQQSMDVDAVGFRSANAMDELGFIS